MFGADKEEDKKHKEMKKLFETCKEALEIMRNCWKVKMVKSRGFVRNEANFFQNEPKNNNQYSIFTHHNKCRP